MAKTAQAVKDKTEDKQDDSKKQAQSVEFSEAAETGASGPGGSIDILLDMNVSVRVTIGQTEIPVRRLLQLGPGAVLRLDKPIHEPVELYLSSTKFATGTVVVVEDRFAVKINRILGVEDPTAQTNES
jgi:flagellar motor switch protein FliN/FliY